MIDYKTLEDMMNTTKNMEHLLPNQYRDSGTWTFDGVDWFQFAGKTMTQIYVNADSWIGFGNNSSHFLLCHRDGALWNFYREEATLFGEIKVFKIRWEGYTQYNSQDDAVSLKYELFFFENGDFFLNLIHPPKSAGYLGTSRLNGFVNQPLNVYVTQHQYISFVHTDEEGKGFDIVYEAYEMHPPFEHRYLLADKDGKYYTVRHERCLVDSILFQGYQLIRTGILPDRDTRLEIRFQTGNFGGLALFGAEDKESGEAFGVFLTSERGITVKYGKESRTAEVDDISGTEVVLELSQEGLKRDGIVIVPFETEEFSVLYELTIGTMDRSDELDNHYFVGCIYSVRAWRGEEQVLDLVPCVGENNQPCFYDNLSETCLYNQGYGAFGFEDTEGMYEKSTSLVETGIKNLTANVILEHGFKEFPLSGVVERLTDPTILYWHESDIDPFALEIDIKATPPPQVVYSKNNKMTDSTILGIESLEIEADDTALFAFSFDAGETWKAYIEHRWVTLREETSGMSRSAVQEVPTEAWNEAAADNQYMVRFTIFEGGYVNRIIIHYLN